MELDEFLQVRGAELGHFVTGVREAVDIMPADILLAAGSVVEGLGNTKSDVDLLLLTSRDEATVPTKEIGLVIGACLADLQLIPIREVENLLARLKAWGSEPWSATHAPSFSGDERRLLHRLLNNIVLYNECGKWAFDFKPDLNMLARLKLQVARHMSRTIQIDMVGNREANDYVSLAFAAQDLLCQAVDGLTAAYTFTNPTPKWRSRILEHFPQSWERPLRVRPSYLSAVESFWRLHRAPTRCDRRSTLSQAFRISTFARASFVWAERHLVHKIQCEENKKRLSIRRQRSRKSLPCLDFDVDFHQDEHTVTIARLNEFEKPVVLRTSEFDAALFFDGITTLREATEVVYGVGATKTNRERIDNVRRGFTLSDYCFSETETPRSLTGV